MGNMSYCRFENTVSDLAECKDALEAFLNCEPNDGYDIQLSGSELAKAKELVELCLEVVQLVSESSERSVLEFDEAIDPGRLIDPILDKAQYEARIADCEEQEDEPEDPAASMYTNPEANR